MTTFYEIGQRQGFASYLPTFSEGSISEPRIIPPHRRKVHRLEEYLGSPPRKPGRHGDLHITDSHYFAAGAAEELIRRGCNDRLVTGRVDIEGRKQEFTQFWVLNFVDCLDIERSDVSPASGFHRNKIGVIRRPVFDLDRWDGSDVFVIPQDPSYALYCTARFVERWKAAKLKGARFSRYLMDPEALNL